MSPRYSCVAARRRAATEPSYMISENPMIALSGVRSSCDMFARNCDLYALARASSSALCSSVALARSSSRAWCCVRSSSSRVAARAARDLERDRDRLARALEQLGVERRATAGSRASSSTPLTDAPRASGSEHQRARRDLDEPGAQREPARAVRVDDRDRLARSPPRRRGLRRARTTRARCPPGPRSWPSSSYGPLARS